MELLSAVLEDSASYFCRLPRHSPLCSRSPPICILLQHESRSSYAMWRGDTHSNTYIILPQRIATELDIQSHDTVCVSEINVDIALLVEVTTAHPQDWELLHRHADTVEQSLLYQIGVVYLHQQIIISLPGSGPISIIVDTIHTNTSHSNEIGASISDSESPTFSWIQRGISSLRLLGFSIGANPVHPTQRQSSSVGRLSGSTQIIVAPPSRIPISKNTSTSITTPSELLDRISKHSSRVLTVLPESLYFEDTNFFSDSVVSDEDTKEISLSKMNNICYIHPEYIQSAILRLSESEDAELSGLFKLVPSIIDEEIACFALLHNTSPTQSLQTAVSLIISNKIRPAFVAVSSSVRRSLAIGDFSLIRIELLSPLILNRLPFPSKIIVNPASLQSSKLRIQQNVQCEPHELHVSICEELARQFSHRSSPLLLSDGYLISIFLSSSSSYEPTEPLIADFMIRMEFSASNLVSCRCLLIDSLEALAAACDIISIESSSVTLFNICQHTNAESIRGYVKISSYEETITKVLFTLSPSLLPSTVLLRVKQNVHPAEPGLILFGEQWSGRSQVLLKLAAYLRSHPRIVAHVEYIDCKRFAGGSAKAIIESISALSWNRPSTIIIFDDIDVICGSTADDNDPNQIDSLMISSYLKCLLESLYKRNEETHKRTAELLSSRMSLPYSDERAVLEALNCCRIVFSAAGPSSLNAALIEALPFTDVFTLPVLNSQDKIHFFISLMTYLNVQVDPTDFFDSVFLSLKMEGLRVGDIALIAKRVRAKASATERIDLCQILNDLDTYVSVSADKLQQFTSPSDNNWDDVIGLSRQKKIIVDTFRRPIIFRRLYNKIPVKLSRAILLYGPPGGGKSFLAGAAGKECGMSFSIVKGPEILDKYIGASEKAIRGLFSVAQNTSCPQLLFFDEFESLAPRRGRDNGGVTDRVVNQLLTFLDGVENTMRGSGSGGEVFVIAASSRPDLIDPALLRPGRIETHIHVGLPTPEERYDLLVSSLELQGSISSYPLSIQVVNDIVKNKKSSQYSAADIINIGNRSLIATIREGCMMKESSRDTTLSIHLRNMFDTSKPSIHERDMLFYDRIYRDFGCLGNESLKSASHTNTHAPKMLLK